MPKPFLTFTCRGPNLNMVQDLPISKPHMPARAPAPPARACPPSPAHEAPHSALACMPPHHIRSGRHALCEAEVPWIVLQPCSGHVQASLRLGGGAEIDRLVADKDITQLCPFYVDLQVEGPRLQVPPSLQSRSFRSTSTLMYWLASILSNAPPLHSSSTRLQIIAVFPMQQELCQMLVV